MFLAAIEICPRAFNASDFIPILMGASGMKANSLRHYATEGMNGINFSEAEETELAIEEIAAFFIRKVVLGEIAT